MSTVTKLKILDPVEHGKLSEFAPAPRLATLDGKTVGLFNNGKLNAAKLLDMVGGLLQKQFNLKSLVRGPFSVSDKADQDWKQADLVILANGD
jgi:hypothetical protein